MKRREFMTLVGGAALAWPVMARAQRSVRRIGAMLQFAENDPEASRRVARFQEGLEKSGWISGTNVHIDYRWRIQNAEAARAACAELLNLPLDVILADNGFALTAAQHATLTIPIVFTGISEPVARGFVQSLAHPGSNITGFSNLEPSIGAKWLELLLDAAPSVKRVAVIFNPASSGALLFFRSIEAIAKNLGVEAIMTHVRDASEIETAIELFSHQAKEALIGVPDGFLLGHITLLTELATRYKLPALFPWRTFTEAGGLMSYGNDFNEQFRQAGLYCGRILRGEKPTDLPVIQPTKFELVINIKTAKALGLEVPPMLLARADEVIE
jgi:putative tryptophan/tyrosine transport system substrate-binding protein